MEKSEGLIKKGVALRKELKKIGICTEEQLNKAIQILPPLNLYIMSSKIPEEPTKQS